MGSVLKKYICSDEFVQPAKLLFRENRLVEATNGTIRGCDLNHRVAVINVADEIVEATVAIHHTAVQGWRSSSLCFATEYCFSYLISPFCCSSSRSGSSNSASSRSPSPNAKRRRFNSDQSGGGAGGVGRKSPIPSRRHAKRSPSPKRRHSPSKC